MMGASVSWRAVHSHGVNFDLSRSDVEILLTRFIVGTQGVEIGTHLTSLGDLPAAYCAHVRGAEASGHAWTAWSTPCGPMAAWGNYARQINAYLLFVERWGELRSHPFPLAALVIL
jgi:hypothetical protein